MTLTPRRLYKLYTATRYFVHTPLFVLLLYYVSRSTKYCISLFYELNIYWGHCSLSSKSNAEQQQYMCNVPTRVSVSTAYHTTHTYIHREGCTLHAEPRNLSKTRLRLQAAAVVTRACQVFHNIVESTDRRKTILGLLVANLWYGTILLTLMLVLW